MSEGPQGWYERDNPGFLCDKGPRSMIGKMEAEKTAAIRAEETRLKAGEQKAAVKAVKEAGEVAEAARKAEEEKTEKPAVIRAEEARPKAKAEERTAAE